jgi:hypothetical protein
MLTLGIRLGASMQDAKTRFRYATAHFDEFLKRAAAEFGSNEADRANTDRRVDEWLSRQYPDGRQSSAA